MSDTAPVAVLGLGNVLLGDDAAGPSTVHWLQANFIFPPGVSVQEIGTPGLDLLPYVSGRRAVIIVDTVTADAPPGEVLLYRKDQIAMALTRPRLSPHDPGLAEAVACAELAGQAPEHLAVVGIVPASTATGMGLSDAVKEAIPVAGARVVRELEELGKPPRPRPVPLPDRPWWETEA